MNEIITVAIATSCVWVVGVLVTYMYWRIKTKIDCDRLISQENIDQVYRNIDDRLREVDASIDDIRRVMDSRFDKMADKFSSQLCNCACLSESKSNKKAQ
jgi:hypothetical protein